MWQRFTWYDVRVIGHYLGMLVLFSSVALIVPLVTAIVFREWTPASHYLLSIGLSLISVGMNSFGGGSSAKDYGSLENLFVGMIVLIVIIALKHGTKGFTSFSSILQVQEGGKAQYAADYIVYTLYRGKYSCLLYLQMVGWR